MMQLRKQIFNTKIPLHPKLTKKEFHKMKILEDY